MINTNGTPNKAGYLLMVRFRGVSVRGLEGKTAMQKAPTEP
jgi:hypothetical protein